jgi:hypothetical protein
MLQISWRTGVNMREFAYYGTAARKYTDSGLQRRQLDALRDLQVKLVRFYASYNQFSTDQCIQRVQAALDLLQSYGMQAVVCLADSLGSEFTIVGDGAFHTGPLGHLDKRYWHERAYNQHFMPFTTSLVRACAQHPAVAMWELGNEYAIHPQPASWDDGNAFLEFAKTASAAIKAAAPQALVSTGLVGTHHVAPQGYPEPFGRDLYGLPSLDAVSIHYYADDGEKMNAQREITLANTLGKPFYIGEFGAPQEWPDRAGYYRSQLDEWYRGGALTALPWAFDASASDVGVSDTKAFAGIRPDFQGIKNCMREFGRAADPIVLKPVKKEEKPPDGAKVFTVVRGPVYMRSAPSLAPGTKVEGRWLVNGQTVEVVPDSRTIADGYIWWKHDDGWSAEASVDGRLVLMIESQSVGISDTEKKNQPDPTKPYDPVSKKTFRVINGPVNWRDKPTLEPRALIKGKSFRTGQLVEVDADSRTEADGYVWWRHSDGWSAERSLTAPLVLMIEEDQVLGASELFARLPLGLDIVRWVQYYGNTTFAYEHGKENNYDGYSQGLHGGLDLGHPGGAAVCAGIRADLNPVCTYVGDQRDFRPNRVDITVGQYLIILGHLTNPDFSLVGKSLTPDTVVGYIDSSKQHVHIEIRRGSKILNPLNFLPESLRTGLIGRFSPAGMFQPNGGQWESPLDQPDIDIGGKVIGPRA